MSTSNRPLAPVAVPPGPKPPVLNLVVSSLQPDLSTDTFAPGEGPELTAAGWFLDEEGRWIKPPGDDRWARHAARHNAALRSSPLVAAGIPAQADFGLAPTSLGSLPLSVFQATSDSDRWTGGFAYAPENQWAAYLRDPCDGTTIDLPALPAPTSLVGTPSNTGGSLTALASPYDYEVTATNANGETVPSTAVTPSIASGSSGSVHLSWAAVRGAAGYKVYGRASGSLGLIATLSGNGNTSFVDTGAVSPGAAPPSSDTTAGPGAYTNEAVVETYPFVVVVEDSCSTFGFSVRDFMGRALRLLDAATPNAVEREFWTGAFATAQGYPNGFLAKGGTLDLTPGTVPSVTRGIQILEDYLANTGSGGGGIGAQGMIHVQPQTSPNLLGARRVGNLLLSVMDNIIVPGSGYAGTGPGGAAPAAGYSWLYATDLVSVRLDDPVVIPGSFAEAVDRATNTVRFRAERYAAATWDGFRHAAVKVALAT